MDMQMPVMDGCTAAAAIRKLDRPDAETVTIYACTANTFKEDVDKALKLNKNAVNAYLIRANISIARDQDFKSALDDMNEAIKLQPRHEGFFINRAYIRRNLDDYYGAISDYDYATQLAPDDYVAFYNRALLYMEVRDFDHALSDLDRVIALKGPDIRAVYNRALVRKEKRDFKERWKM